MKLTTLCLQMTHTRHHTIASPITNYRIHMRCMLHWVYNYTYIDCKCGGHHPGLLAKCTFKCREIISPVVE